MKDCIISNSFRIFKLEKRSIFIKVNLHKQTKIEEKYFKIPVILCIHMQSITLRNKINFKIYFRRT
jgi:hypothetical protein